MKSNLEDFDYISEDEKLFFPGQMFIIEDNVDKSLVQLTQVAPNQMNLIVVSGNDSGNRYTDSVKKDNPRKWNLQEIRLFFSLNGYKVIPVECEVKILRVT